MSDRSSRSKSAHDKDHDESKGNLVLFDMDKRISVERVDGALDRVHDYGVGDAIPDSPRLARETGAFEVFKGSRRASSSSALDFAKEMAFQVRIPSSGTIGRSNERNVLSMLCSPIVPDGSHAFSVLAWIGPSG
jgi:hypothetical protein